MKLTHLDKVFSAYMKLRAKNICEYCGKPPDTWRGYQLHHFIRRRFHNTRWLEDNCACLCGKCHNELHSFAKLDHQFFARRVGDDRLDEMWKLARSGKKVDKQQLMEYYKERLKEE